MTPALPPWLAAFPSAQVRDLDPRRHALLEASAGTGKTFAIEHLVMRVLVENPKWNPEEILLLSFTEKTVGELRDRIRTLLHAQVDESNPGKRIPGWSDADRERLRTLWLHADDLSIHTLHAFCQSAVQRDPLENSALIRTELTEDRALADIALDGLLRGSWTGDPVRFARLKAALGINTGGEWRKKLIGLALKWQPWRGDVFDPERDPDTLEGLEAEAAAVVETFPGIVKAVDEGGYSIEAHAASFAFTTTGRAKKNPEAALEKDPWMKVFRFATERPANPRDPAWSPETVLGFFRKNFKGNMRVITQGWESELPPKAQERPEWVRFAATCGLIRALWDKIEFARAQRTFGLQAEAAQELRAALDAEKLRLGRISYDDMPRRLVEALRRNPALAPRLRSRYKICIVDEFQDTDPIQWEILQHLCLPDDPPASGAMRRDETFAFVNHQSSIINPPSSLPQLPLVLVGDPKQAIYAFRGGDLRTYLRARDTFLTLAQSGRAQGIALNANFRSRPALIDTLNGLFGQADWFGPPPESPEDASWQLPGKTDGIAFVPVKAGLRETANVGPALVARDFATERHDGIGALRRAVRRWIVARIVSRLRDGKTSGLRARDFAVLTRGSSEGESIARMLRECGVPCRIRRRGSVFQGPAADALRLLIEWIGDAADPDAQARILLLPFARRTASDLPSGRPIACPPLVSRWAALARDGRWPEFLNAVSYEGGYRDRLAAESPADATGFDRLVRLLAEAGAVPGTPAQTLCDHFDALRRSGEKSDGDDAGDDSGTEEGAEAADAQGFVTVMTMHLSKGLEFRHVFIAATGAGKGDSHLVLRDEHRTGFRIALDTKRSGDKEQAERETHEENRRLYYVACTRAKETLYLPVLPAGIGAKGSTKTGPLGQFVADAVRAHAGDPARAGSIRWDEDPVREESLRPVGPSAPNDIGVERMEVSREELVTRARATFLRRRRLTSYSRLAVQAGPRGETGHRPATIAADPLLQEDGRRAERQESVSDETALIGETGEATQGSNLGMTQGSSRDATTSHPDLEVITAAELPPGAAAGTALHALLEHTPFATAKESDTPRTWLDMPGHRTRVEETLRREGVDPAFAPAAARAVWNALRCPLPIPKYESEASTDSSDERMALTSSFRLADLAVEDIRHEVEFLMPFDTEARHDRLPERVAVRGAFLWGFIDLVYRHAGRYYLLDWKSNLLPAYDAESVARAMNEHRYDLQWKLYAIALDRWLTARVSGYDPARHFGGVHYLFLRGATPERFAGFSVRPTVAQLRVEFPAEIASLLGAPRSSEAA